MLNTAWLQAKLDPSKVAPEVPTEMAPANETIERGNMSKDTSERSWRRTSKRLRR